MMGYAKGGQDAAGLLQRTFARTFIALDDETNKRFAFVSLDAGMGGQVLKNRVLAQLAQLGLGDLYFDENVAVSGTHTHSAPGGFLQDTLFLFSAGGFSEEVLGAYVTGVVQSIVKADANLVPASASIAVGELDDASVNRSPQAYDNNPAEERAFYGSNKDTNMTLLKLVSEDGRELGVFNWFAVHATSMNNTNLLVNGDNKGYASYLFERRINGNTESGAPPGAGAFVAGFAASNLGDISPNTDGPKCQDTGLPCDVLTSTCPDEQGRPRNKMCWALGPGANMFESTTIIGEKQYERAASLYDDDDAQQPLVRGAAELTAKQAERGAVEWIHSYVRYPDLEVLDPNTGAVVGALCEAAVGDSFAAGTTDGPGVFDFTQADNSSNPLWHFAVGLVHKSTPEQEACQAPKSILLPTGSWKLGPWPWAPDVLPLQLLRLGDLVLVSVSTELSTMAGRRLRAALRTQLVADGLITEGHGKVVVAGLANAYSDYTVTFEEYQIQRYEGASTIYGPHQLGANIQELLKLAKNLADGVAPPAAEAPEDFSAALPNILSGRKQGLKNDVLPEGASAFGDVLSEVDMSAGALGAGDVARVTFAGANPLNDLRLQGTYAEVQRCVDLNCTEWTTVAVDGDWETRVHVRLQEEPSGKRKQLVPEVVEMESFMAGGKSLVTPFADIFTADPRTWEVEWVIPAGTTPGRHRIVHSHVSVDELAPEEQQAPCTVDIAAAVDALADAGRSIAKAVVSCVSGDTTSCVADIADTVASLADAGVSINSAVTTCGAEGSECAADLLGVVADLAKAASAVTAAVDDCSGGVLKVPACIRDVKAAVAAIKDTVQGIVAATSSCPGGDDAALNGRRHLGKAAKFTEYQGTSRSFDVQ